MDVRLASKPAVSASGSWALVGGRERLAA